MTPKTWTLGIIGYPLGYSLSPLLHAAAFKALESSGVRGTYAEYPVPPEGLAAWLARDVAALGLDGFNVTIPHKEAVFAWIQAKGRFPFLQNPEEEWIGAVNTVKVERGTLVGYNTDARGFLDVLTRPEVHARLGHFFRLDGARVVVLGAGGSARAVAYALIWHKRVGELLLWNRHPDRAAALATHLTALCGEGAGRRCRVEVLPAPPSEAVLAETALLVNTVPVSDELLVDPEALGPGLVVYDLVYHPPWTALLKAAKRRGAVVISGLEMLASQAALAFHFWINDQPDSVRPIMIDALRAQVGDQWPS